MDDKWKAALLGSCALNVVLCTAFVFAIMHRTEGRAKNRAEELTEFKADHPPAKAARFREQAREKPSNHPTKRANSVAFASQRKPSQEIAENVATEPGHADEAGGAVRAENGSPRAGGLSEVPRAGADPAFIRPNPARIEMAVGSGFVPGPRAAAKSKKITMPLVFQHVDPVALNLNDEQIAAIQDLQQKFVEDIGGLDQDAHDPAYRERWQKSQPEIDGLLWWRVGKDIYQQIQIQGYAADPSGTGGVGSK